MLFPNYLSFAYREGVTPKRHLKISRTRNRNRTDPARALGMKIKQLVSLVVAIVAATLGTTWAAGHGGGGGAGGFVAGGGGGHVGGSAGHVGGAGGIRSGGPGFRSGPYYYSRGMRFANSGAGQLRAPVRQSPSNTITRPGTNNSPAHQLQASGQRPGFNSMMAHVAERHSGNWHNDWDRRHAHFEHNRFFVFIDGFWCGLDPGFFPWDYYPYYAYDYYPYDYYPGYYADVEPNYYNENVYSNEPMRDPTVSAVQTELTQLGYYNGPVDGIFGPTTRDAVAKYQIEKKLEVTGSLSAQTLESFRLPEPTRAS